MKKQLTVCLVFASCMMLNAQDIHFSQFFFAPQILNPAEIGNFNAAYRSNANQKTQWREVSRPFSTFAISGDGKFQIGKEQIGAGLSIMNDNSGDSRFNTFQFLFGGSYDFDLTDNKEHSLRLGLQMGLTQIKINEDFLNFNNQFNGVAFDPNLPTGENFVRNNRWYFNLNLGGLYTWKLSARKTISAGFASHNITSPDQSFYNDTGVDLPLRNSLYANATWRVHEKIDALPSIRYMSQGSFSEFIIGTAARYELLNEGPLYRAAFLGYYGRFGDSGIAMAGFYIDAWRFALSYDINLSELERASRNQGGFEFSLQYLVNRPSESLNRRHKYCPVFL
jgi:type IX secretion system PorP/SprF family membrane protein